MYSHDIEIPVSLTKRAKLNDINTTSEFNKGATSIQYTSHFHGDTETKTPIHPNLPAFSSSSSLSKKTSSFFSTAKGGRVQFSADIVAKANAILAQDDSITIEKPTISLCNTIKTFKNEPMSMSEPIIQPITDFGNSSGVKFQTAKGKNVRISTAAIERAKNLLKNSASFEVSKNQAMSPEQLIDTSKTITCKCDNEILNQPEGNSVHIQSKDLIHQNSSQIIEDYPVNKFDMQLSETLNDLVPNLSTLVNHKSSFQPAHGRNIVISTESRIKASNILNDTKSSSFEKILHSAKHISGQSNLEEINFLTSPNIITPLLFPFPSIDRDTLLSSPIFIEHPQQKQSIHLNGSALYSSVRMTHRYKILSEISSSNACKVIFEGDNLRFCLNETFKKIVYDHVSNIPLPKEMNAWVDMQLNWIIWTFASYERRFTEKYFGKLLTPQIILHCMATRYNIYSGYGVSGLSPPMNSSSQKKGHVSAKSYFSRRGAMSPLQRFTEIQVFQDPLVLCFMARVTRLESNNEEEFEFSLTDGWWITKTSVDSRIRKLVKKKKLRDGTKIIVFSAIIKSEGRTSVISLTANNIRKVKNTNPLGICHPKYLNRGISLKSIVPDGGSVYAIRAKIISICPAMCRIKLSGQPQDSHFNSSVRFNDAKILMSFYEKKKLNVPDIEEEDDMKYMVNSLECEGWIKKALMDMHTGNELNSQLSEADLKKLLKAKDKLLNKRRQSLESTMRESMTELEVTWNAHVDILVQCSISSHYGWVRIPVAADSENEIQKSLESFRIFVGESLAFLSLSPSIYNRTKTLLLVPGKSFSVQACKQALKYTDMPSPIGRFENLRDMLTTAENNFSPRHLDEIIFNCTVLDMIVSNISTTPGFSKIEIHGADSSFVSVLVEYFYPTDIIANVTKELQTGRQIEVICGTVVRVDSLFEIVTIGHGDRMTINVLDIGSETISSSDWAMHENQKLISLRQNKMEYIYGFYLLSCERIKWRNASVQAALLLPESNTYVIAVSQSDTGAGNMCCKEVCYSALPIEWRRKLEIHNQMTDGEWMVIGEQCDIVFSRHSLNFASSSLKVQTDGNVFAILKTQVQTDLN